MAKNLQTPGSNTSAPRKSKEDKASSNSEI